MSFYETIHGHISLGWDKTVNTLTVIDHNIFKWQIINQAKFSQSSSSMISESWLVNHQTGQWRQCGSHHQKVQNETLQNHAHNLILSESAKVSITSLSYFKWLGSGVGCFFLLGLDMQMKIASLQHWTMSFAYFNDNAQWPSVFEHMVEHSMCL